MLSNCGVGEDSCESLGLQGDQTSPFQRKSTLVFIGSSDAEAPIFWPPDVKSQLIRKTLMLGKIDGREGGNRA